MSKQTAEKEKVRVRLVSGNAETAFWTDSGELATIDEKGKVKVIRNYIALPEETPRDIDIYHATMMGWDWWVKHL